MPEIGDVEYRTPEQLIEVIKGSQDIDIFRQCFDEGAIVQNGDEYNPFDVDEALLKEILERNSSVYDRYLESDQEGRSLLLPPDFDMEKEAQAGFKTVVNILYPQVLDIKTVRGASNFLGPKSVIISPDEYTVHTFVPTLEFLSWAQENEMELDREKYGRTQVFPPSKERGKYFVLKIGGGSVRTMAAHFMNEANKIGMELKTNQALRLDMIAGIGHEYGHGVKRVFDNQGISTQARSLEKGYLKRAFELGVDIETLHDEKFACFIGLEVQIRYLEQLGFSGEEVLAFVGRDDELRGRITESAYAFLEYMRQKGLTPLQTLQLESYCLMYGAKVLGKDIFLWRAEQALAYIAPPYTKDQFRELTKR